MNRRRLLTLLGLGSLSTGLTSLISGCASGSQTLNKETAAAISESSAEKAVAGFLKIGSTNDLKEKGRLLITEASQPVLVIEDSSQPNGLVATKPVCTHKGCSVDWDPDQGSIFCPCHGSTYKADGTVVNGPAVDPLPRYEVKVEGDSILVDFG